MLHLPRKWIRNRLTQKGVDYSMIYQDRELHLVVPFARSKVYPFPPPYESGNRKEA
jgi:hypothetical protein